MAYTYTKKGLEGIYFIEWAAGITPIIIKFMNYIKCMNSTINYFCPVFLKYKSL